MLQLSNIINYFHDCYRSDNRELVLYDFLDRKVENCVVLEGKEELINGNYPIVPFKTEVAEILSKKLEVFEKEKELLYGCFFVCGHYIDFKWKINNYWIGFPIAGLQIDLLIKHNNQYIGIDLIGYPGDLQHAFGVERNRILNRAGIKIFPLPYSNWHFEKSTTQKTLKDFILKE